MATTLEIIRGISQAISNSYDGAVDAEGEKVKIGLKREEGDPLVDSRVMDGFSVKVGGNMLCVSYQSDMKLKDVHRTDVEGDVDRMIEQVVSFLKKEFRKATGETLSLKVVGEVDALVQRISGIRTTVVAKKNYKIGNIDSESIAPEEKKLDDSIRKFLELGKSK